MLIYLINIPLGGQYFTHFILIYYPLYKNLTIVDEKLNLITSHQCQKGIFKNDDEKCCHRSFDG